MHGEPIKPASGQPSHPPSSDRRRLVEVAAGLVFHRRQLLITQRRQDDHLGGLWEFPGGKREPGETFEACLCRELREELAIDVEPLELLETIVHDYPEKAVYLKFFRCRLCQGEPHTLGCQAFAWVSRDDLSRFEFPAADVQVLEILRTRQDLWQ